MARRDRIHNFFFAAPLKQLIASLKEFSVSKDGLTGRFDREYHKTFSNFAEAKIEAAAKLSPDDLQLLDKRESVPENVRRIVFAWKDLEGIVENGLKQCGIDTETFGISELLQSAYGHHIITNNEYKSLVGLNTMRNLAMHGRSDEVDDRRTQEFLSMADAMKTILSLKNL